LPEAIRFIALLFGWIVWVLMVIVSYRFCLSNQADRLKWLILLTVMYASLVPLFLVTGMREHVFMPVLLIVLGYILARGRPPWKFIIVASVLLFFLISPWLSVYKISKSSVDIDKPFFERLEDTNAKLSLVSTRGRFELALYGLVARAAGAGAAFVPVYASYYPDVYPFEFGQTFLMELQTLIPRIVWPEKPNISLELNRYTSAVGMLREHDEYDESVTSATFDAVSEYYLNFGTTGVFFLSILQGYYFRILYEWLVRRSIYEIGGSVYLVLFFSNHDFFGVVQNFVSHTRQLPVWLFILYVMSRSSNRYE
jgi:hypothetical protein